MSNFIDADEVLFARGFALYPSHANLCDDVWSDLSSWKIKEVKGYTLRHHPSSSVSVGGHQQDSGVILVGNAVNPFSGEIEDEIVSSLVSQKYRVQEDGSLSEELIGYIDQLTGRFQLFFIKNGAVCALCDATGLAPLYFCQNDDNFFFSSHSQLLAELVDSERDGDLQEIIDSPFYSIGRRHLPGYKSPFKGIDLVGANVYLSSLIKRRVRVFPREPLSNTSTSLSEIVLDSADILQRTAALYISSRAVLISLSLGQDSRINLSAFHEWRREIETYSYCGNLAETAEANRVHAFSRDLGVKHHIVDTKNVSSADCQDLVGTLDRTTAYMRKHKSTELEKLVAMKRWFPAGALEIKGEASEVGRATYSKRSGIKNFPQLDVRAMSNLYKRVLYPRHLLKRIDGYFEEFKSDGGFGFSSLGYDDYDMFFWEHRTACCVSLGMQDHDIYHDASALMNNRLLLKRFLLPDFESRLEDKLHKAVCEKLWPGILDTPTSKRGSLKGRTKILAENLFFRANRF
ncbi:hypothetical protein QLQ86_13725 [Halomonas sp. LR5S13]|uniref:hypothetical protein n=1 Tax=Halomonas rhizosphaerae TaxID=3043296 RepID=UPI0024A7CF5D|nr:hypothetical protein [Halomonas rhizosphaerae]MDI5921853.1 hypothetical protein [Halomonas rhizosphaerae]